MPHEPIPIPGLFKRSLVVDGHLTSSDMSAYLKQYEYYEFVRWSALPEQFREPKSQMEFQERFNLSRDTLARWKRDSNFDEDVRRVLKEWGRSKTPTVIGGLYKRIVSRGDPEAVKLWLGIFEKGLADNVSPLSIEISDAERVLIFNAFVNFNLLNKPTDEKENSLNQGSGADNK